MALGDLVINISAGTARFQRDLGRAARIAAKESQKMRKQFLSITQGLVKLTTGSAAAGGALIAMTERAVANADALAKQAKQSGISAESLQEYAFAAERGGASASLLGDGVSRFNKRLGQAVAGGGPAVKMFKQLGIEILDTNGQVRSTEAVLDETVDKLGQLGSQAEKSAAASALFGVDAGQKLANALGIGGDAVRELREEKRKLGIISNETAERSEAVADALTNVREQAGAALQNALLSNQDLVLELAKGFAEMVTQVSSAVNSLKEFYELIRDPGESSPQVQQLANSLAAIEEQIIQTKKLRDSFGESAPDYQRLTNVIAGLEEKQKKVNEQWLAAVRLHNLAAEGKVIDADATEELNDTLEDAEDNLKAIIPPLSLIPEEAAKGAAKVKTLDEKLSDLLDTLDPTRVSARELADQLVTLNLSAAAGKITQEELAAATKKLTDEFWDAEAGTKELVKQVKQTKKEFDPMVKAFEAAVERIDGLFVDLWESALGGGLSSFADQAVSTIRRMMAEIIQATARRVLINIGFLAPGLGGAAASGVGAAASGGLGLLGAAGGLSPLLFSSGVTGATLTSTSFGAFPLLTGGAPTGLLSGFAGFSGGIGSGFSGLGGALTGANGALGFLGAAGAIIGVISLLSSLLKDDPDPRLTAVTNLNSRNPDPRGINGVSPFSFNGTNLLLAAQQVTSPVGRQNAQAVINAGISQDQIVFDLLDELQRAAVGRGFVTGADGSLRETRDMFTGDFEAADVLESRLRQIFSFLEGELGATVRRIDFSGSEEGIQVLQSVQQLLSTIGEETNGIAAYQDAIINGPVSAIEQIQAAGEQLRNATVPQSLADVQALTSANQLYTQQVLQFISAIDQVKANIDQITASTTNSIRFQLLDRDGQVDFLNQQIADLVNGITGNSSESDIQRRIQQANALSQQLFGLLTPEEQQQRGGDIISFLDRWNTTAQAELDVLREAAVEDSRQTFQEQRELLATEVVQPMGEHVDRFGEWVEAGYNIFPSSFRITNASAPDREAAPA